jgi:hypothetical protein
MEKPSSNGDKSETVSTKTTATIDAQQSMLFVVGVLILLHPKIEMKKEENKRRFYSTPVEHVYLVLYVLYSTMLWVVELVQ